MKFENTGSSNSGHKVSLDHAELRRLCLYDPTKITAIPSCSISMEEDEENNTTKLIFDWGYMILHNGNEIFDFNSTSKYWISEEVIIPTEDELLDVLNRSYKNISAQFESRREEYSMFKKMPDISADTTSQYLPQLRQVLAPFHKSEETPLP